MIIGRVNARLEATLQLQIEDSSGHLHMIDTVIDTGFNGDLTLPNAQISTLELSWRGELVTQLADGSEQTLDAYDGILMWDENPVLVRIQAVETTPLLGTRLLAGHELKVPFVPGGTVTITPLPTGGHGPPSRVV